MTLNDLTLGSGTLTGAGDITVAGSLNLERWNNERDRPNDHSQRSHVKPEYDDARSERTLQNDGTATWTVGALQMNGGTFINNGKFYGEQWSRLELLRVLAGPTRLTIQAHSPSWAPERPLFCQQYRGVF